MLQCGRLLSYWSLNEKFNREKKTLSVATEDGSKTSTLRAADTKLAAHQHSASTMHSRGSNCSLTSHQLFFFFLLNIVTNHFVMMVFGL